MSEIDLIYELDDDLTRCLYTAEHSNQTIEVREYDTLRWLTIDGIAIQSVMDTVNIARLLNPVSQHLLSGIGLVERLDRILNLGFGGGSIERFLSHHAPKLEVDSVESNELIIHLAREFFAIPDTAPVFHNTAEAFLASCEQRYSLILCDIFNRESHPECLYDKTFYLDCHQCLNADGLLIMNLTPQNEQDLINILLPMRATFKHGYLYKIHKHFNVIVFACNKEMSICNQAYHALINKHCAFTVEHLVANLTALPCV